MFFIVMLLISNTLHHSLKYLSHYAYRNYGGILPYIGGLE